MLLVLREHTIKVLHHKIYLGITRNLSGRDWFVFMLMIRVWIFLMTSVIFFLFPYREGKAPLLLGGCRPHEVGPPMSLTLENTSCSRPSEKAISPR